MNLKQNILRLILSNVFKFFDDEADFGSIDSFSVIESLCIKDVVLTRFRIDLLNGFWSLYRRYIIHIQLLFINTLSTVTGN